MTMVMMIIIVEIMRAARDMLKYTVPCGDDDGHDQDSGDNNGRS